MGSANAPGGGVADGRRARGHSTRAALVDAAVDVVTTSGFTALTLREVAGRAGVSAASATYHFGTVDALLADVLRTLEDRSTARLAELTRRSRAGELSLLDACTTYLVTLFGPERRTFLTMLEIRVQVARDPHRDPADDEQDAQVVDLIQDYTGNRDRARELFAAVFGFAALGALAAPPPDEQRVRAYMATLLARYDLLDPTVLGGRP